MASSHPPHTHTSASSSNTQIDFVRAASTLADDVSNFNSHKPTEQQPQFRNSRQDYVARRMALWDGPDAATTTADGNTYSEVELGAISRLPLSLQVAFRWKMLTIFALQLFYVWALVGACVFYPQANDIIKRVFENQTGYLVGAIVGVVVLLVLLYVIRNLFPLNWLVLLAFSTTQAVAFAGLGVTFDTNIGFFNCGASFSCIVIMILLSGVRKRQENVDDEGKLLSSIAAGFIAYLVVALASCGLFANFGQEFVTSEGFGASLAFQFALIMWFSIDAASMYRVMSPDEYMHGVIYFYTDMVLICVICAVAVGAIALCAVFSDSDCSGCGSCGGCSSASGGDSNSPTETCTWSDCCAWLYWCSFCADCQWCYLCQCDCCTKKEERRQDSHASNSSTRCLEHHHEGYQSGPFVLNKPGTCGDTHKENAPNSQAYKDLEMQRV